MRGILIRRLRGKGKKEAIADAAISGAEQSSIRHIEFIFDRIDREKRTPRLACFHIWEQGHNRHDNWPMRLARVWGLRPPLKHSGEGGN